MQWYLKVSGNNLYLYLQVTNRTLQIIVLLSLFKNSFRITKGVAVETNILHSQAAWLQKC